MNLPGHGRRSGCTLIRGYGAEAIARLAGASMTRSSETRQLMQAERLRPGGRRAHRGACDGEASRRGDAGGPPGQLSQLR